MVKAVVVEEGVVENVNVEPPLELAREVAATVALTVYRLAAAVVAPELPETAMVHVTGRLTRAGEEHDKVEAVVGLPYTANVYEPEEIVAP